MKNSHHVVFGATGGIGRVLCRTLQHQGAHVFAVGHSAEKLQALQNEMGGLPGCLADVTKSREVDKAMQQAQTHFKQIDGVAHCVGSLFLRPLQRASDDEIHDHVAINLLSALFVVRAATRAMQHHGGSIVLVSSVAARYGLPNHEVIAAAKAGIIGLVLSAASSHAQHNIRINAVAPGLIQTPLTKGLTHNETAAAASAAMHPLGRLGEAEDIASSIGFLLDPAHNFITAQVWGVDGGMSRARPVTSRIVARSDD